MSTCNVDKWNMLAPTFDAFEIPKIGEDDCLTLINDLKLVTKDSFVMDIGCGAGRYAIAFAQMCRSVIGTDLSPQMIDYAQKRADSMGLNHISYRPACGQLVVSYLPLGTILPSALMS